jgi:hypothetical protein
MEHEPQGLYLLMVADISKAARLGLQSHFNYDLAVWKRLYEYAQDAAARPAQEQAGENLSLYRKHGTQPIRNLGRLQAHANRDAAFLCDHIAKLSPRGEKRQWYQSGLAHLHLAFDNGHNKDKGSVTSYTYSEAVSMFKSYIRLGMSQKDEAFAETMYNFLHNLGSKLRKDVDGRSNLDMMLTAQMDLSRSYFEATGNSRMEPAHRLYDLAMKHLEVSYDPQNSVRIAAFAAEGMLDILHDQAKKHSTASVRQKIGLWHRNLENLYPSSKLSLSAYAD